MTSSHETSNGRWNSQRRNGLLKIPAWLSAWAAMVFQGARNSRAQWAGVLILAATLGAISSVLAETEGEYTYYTYNQKATITKYDGPGWNVVIPNSINGYLVTCIGEGAFYGHHYLTSVVIPDSVTSIGDQAFGECEGLFSVYIPDSVVRIGDGAFSGCTSLYRVLIPDSVTSLGESAFENCKNLSTIHLPDSLTSLKPRSFAGCTSLNIIRFGRNLELIGDEAFKNCSSLQVLFLPASLNATGNDAFLGCNQLRKIYYLGGLSDSARDTFPPEATIYYREGTPGWGDCSEAPFDASAVVMLPTDNSEDFEYVIERGEVTITRYKGLNSRGGDAILLVCVPPRD